MRPYWKAYFRRYHEKPNGVLCSRMSKILAQLEREYSPSDVLARFARYLERTSAEWFSVPHFAETWPAWGLQAKGPAASTGPIYLTADELDRRAGILP